MKASKKEVEDFYAILGACIKEVRVSNEMSQKAFAKYLGVSLQQVQKYENGKNRFSLFQLMQISKKFKFSLGDFLEALKGDTNENQNYNTVTMVRHYNKLCKEDQEMLHETIALMAKNKNEGLISDK